MKSGNFVAAVVVVVGGGVIGEGFDNTLILFCKSLGLLVSIMPNQVKYGVKLRNILFAEKLQNFNRVTGQSCWRLSSKLNLK